MTDNEQEFAPNNIFLPLIFRRGNAEGDKLYNHLVETYSSEIIIDQFASQRKELFKIKNPEKLLTDIEIERLYNAWIIDRKIEEEGCWVYYPWLCKMIHILEKEEFISVRTNRNFYKITPEEQELLSKKTIGIIGLSVGHAVATTMATERVCGTIKLADFDTIDLSNLNRIRTGIQNIGLNKCIVTAREIAQIDPFINLDCYTEGLNADNIHDFLLSGKRLDLLVDECDGIDMKILCRVEAKKLGIPVVMDTSDRGMLDIERFDLEPERPIFHGFLKDVPENILLNIPPSLKTALTLKIIDITKSSSRGKASLLEVGKTITTWPQLASSVTMGGGVVTEAVRSILLNEHTSSGRVYIDVENLLRQDDIDPFKVAAPKQGVNDIKEDSLEDMDHFDYSDNIDFTTLKRIVTAGSQAPSLGNNQPWNWVFEKDDLNLYYDSKRNLKYRDPFGHFDYLSLGAAFQNVIMEMEDSGLGFKVKWVPEMEKELVATIEITEKDKIFDARVKSSFINSRTTNRQRNNCVISKELLEEFMRFELTETNLQLCTDHEKVKKLNTLIAECEKVLLLNTFGHEEYFSKMIASAGNNRGMSAKNLYTSPQQAAIFNIIEDPFVVKHLKTIKGGSALSEIFRNDLTPPMGFVTINRSGKKAFFEGGREIQKLWLKAEELNLNLQPVLSPLFIFQYLDIKGQMIFDKDEINQIELLRIQFKEIFTYDILATELFLFKLFEKDETISKEIRVLSSDILKINNDRED